MARRRSSAISAGSNRASTPGRRDGVSRCAASSSSCAPTDCGPPSPASAAPRRIAAPVAGCPVESAPCSCARAAAGTAITKPQMTAARASCCVQASARRKSLSRHEAIAQFLPKFQALGVVLGKLFGRLALPDLGIDPHFVAAIDLGKVLVRVAACPEVIRDCR